MSSGQHYQQKTSSSASSAATAAADSTSNTTMGSKAGAGSWADEGKAATAFEALFDSGYGSTTLSVNSSSNLFLSQNSVDLETDFNEKLSLRSHPCVSSQSHATDSGLCLDSGLSLDSNAHITSPVAQRDIFKQLTSQITERLNSSTGYNPFKCDEDGDTLLHLAISKELTDVCFNIIRNAPHPDCLDIYNNLCQTPLHIAALTGQSDVIRRLIVAGATVDKRNKRGNTALHLSCEIGDLEAVANFLRPIPPGELTGEWQQLLYPTKNSSSSIVNLIDLPNYEGQTCVHLAGRSGNLKLVQFLSSVGGNINAQEGKSGRTLLHWAVAAQKVDLVQFLLLSPDLQVHVNAKSYAGHTALDIAWSLFQVLPNNARVRAMILLLVTRGGEPRSLSSAASLASYSDSESSEEEDSDEEMSCSVAL